MICATCSAALAEGARFCSQCGSEQTPRARARPYPALDRLSDDVSAELKAAANSEFARGVAKAGKTGATFGRAALGSKLGREMAAGAALGAVIAVPIPFIGSLLGASIGASYAAYKNFTR